MWSTQHKECSVIISKGYCLSNNSSCRICNWSVCCFSPLVCGLILPHKGLHTTLTILCKSLRCDSISLPYLPITLQNVWLLCPWGSPEITVVETGEHNDLKDVTMFRSNLRTAVPSYSMVVDFPLPFFTEGISCLFLYNKQAQNLIA